MRTRTVFFFGIVIFNIALKAIYAGIPPFSYDEIISVKNTLMEFGHLKHEAEWDNNPPFYYYVLWIWQKLTPISEFNSRILSVIFISLSIGVTFLFAERYFSRQVSIWTCSFLTVSNFLHYYAQEARSYSLVVLLSITSTYLYFIYTERQRKIDLVVLSIVNFLLIYTHYIAGLLLVFQYVLFLGFGRPNRRDYLGWQTLIIVLLIALRFTKGQFLHILGFNSSGSFWLKESNLDDLVRISVDLFADKIVVLILAIVHVLYLISLINKKSSNAFRDTYLLVAGTGSILILFFVGIFKPLFLARYVIFAVLFATILFVQWSVERKWFGQLLLVGSMIVFLTHYKMVKPSVMDFRSVARIISHIKAQEDIVYVNTRDNLGLFLYYFDRDAFLADPVPDSAGVANRIYGVNDFSDLGLDKIYPGSKIFLVQAFHKLESTDNPIKSYLKECFNLVYTTEQFEGVEFSVLVGKGSKPIVSSDGV